jgi:formate dehydrogenase subunit gamma
VTTSAPPAPAAPAATRRPRFIQRFGVAERLLHWLFTVDVTLLVLSGLGLYLPPERNPVLERRALMHTIHIDAAIGMFVLPLLFVALWPHTARRLWRDVEWFDADDWRWLRRIGIPRFLRRKPLPAQGFFNAGQKLNTIAVAAATVGFIGTGVIMDYGARLPPSWSDAADTWHIWLMYLGAPLLAGHIILAVLPPSTRPSMRGIVTGWVRLDFARRRHAKWVAVVVPDGGDSD